MAIRRLNPDWATGPVFVIKVNADAYIKLVGIKREISRLDRGRVVILGLKRFLFNVTHLSTY